VIARLSKIVAPLASIAPLLTLASPAVAQKAAVVTYLNVTTGGPGQVGGGLLVRGTNGCAVLTAAHVIKDAVGIRVSPSEGTRWLGEATSPELKNESDDAVGVVEPLESERQDAQECPPPPSADAIAHALQSSRDAVLLVALSEKGGTLQSLPLLIDRIEDYDVTLRTPPGSPEITKGMSGSPILVNSVPVAILSNVQVQRNGKVVAMRLDRAATLLGARFFTLPTAAAPVVAQADPQAALAAARASRPSGDMGQVAALQAMSATGKAVSGVDLAAIGFSGGRFAKLIARKTDFDLADLSAAQIEQGDLSGATFNLADLTKANFRKATLDRSTGTFITALGARFDEAKLGAIGWRAATLADVTFVGASLDGASLTFSDLRRADFRGAHFADLVLIGSDLRGARFDQRSARSIDVTGALFNDDTFPTSLKPALCATSATGDVELLILNVFNPALRTQSDYNDLSEESGRSLRLRHRVDRFFPSCPSRAGKLGEDHDAMIDQPGAAGEKEAVHRRIRVAVPNALLAAGGRQQAMLASIRGVVEATKSRDAALETSNVYYRDRPGLLAASLKRNLAAASMPARIWLDDLTLVLLAGKEGFEPITAVNVIRARFLAERFKRLLPAERQSRDNWTLLFPETMTNTDFTPDLQVMVRNWAVDAAARLPSAAQVSVADAVQGSGSFENVVQLSSIEDVLAPYKSALHDANYARYNSRYSDCLVAVSPPYDPTAKAQAQKKTGYVGRSQQDCQWFNSAEPDKKAIFGGAWYEGRTFLRLTAANDNVWILAVDAAPPPELIDADHALRAGVIAGRISRVVKLPPPGSPSIYDAGRAEAGPQRVVVLDGVRYTADRRR
jgi:uncharacterized protein YjbI with pentapeptide repeats